MTGKIERGRSLIRKWGRCVAGPLFLLSLLSPSLSRARQLQGFVSATGFSTGVEHAVRPEVPSPIFETERGIGRDSYPSQERGSWERTACVGEETVNMREDEDGGSGLFANPSKARRLLSTMRKIDEGILRTPPTHAANAGLDVTEEEDKSKPEKSLLSKLYRKWRLESKRPRSVEEVYPDETAERQRKRLVRKTATHILNLAAQKNYKVQQEKIAELERVPLPAPPGLKSLGWKGDARFKNPLSLSPAPGAEKNKKKGTGSGAARAKPVQKRSPKDETIKLFGELLRDKEWVRQFEAKARSKNSDYRALRRIETRHARKVERAILTEIASPPAPAASAPPPAEASRSNNLGLRGGANPGANSPHLLLLWRCVPAAHAAARDKLRLRGGAESGANSGANSPNLGLRGGAGVPAWCAALLPSSYPSASAWFVALAKIVLAQMLKVMGVPVPSFLAGTARGAVAGAAAAAEVEVELPACIKSVIEGTKYKEEVWKTLRGQAVCVVTNNIIFRQEDIEEVFRNPTAKAPAVIAESRAALYRLARDTKLYLITQLPHSGLQNLTAFWASRTKPSSDPANPHGDYYTDVPETRILEALNETQISAAGYNMNRTLFCETVDGRGFIARVLGENYAAAGRLALYADDNPQSVEWFQNVCRNTTVVAVSTQENGGNFATPKHASPPVLVSSLDEFFTLSEPEAV